MRAIAVLFARADSVYRTLPDVDVWDSARDALRWPGGCPLVAHPPCRAWGRLRQFSKPADGEKALALFALAAVRQYGGVLEHPAESTLWIAACLPRPGRMPDSCGGYTAQIDQFNFGHRAEKTTWLYIVGCHPDDLPPIPARNDVPMHCVRPTKAYPRLPSITKPEREHTPLALAEWLCEVARRSRVRC